MKIDVGGWSTGAAVLAVVCAAGCGTEAARPGVSVAEDLPFARSGQRLKVLAFAAEDIDLFSTFHDSQLDADCEFVSNPAGDHAVCFPRATVDVVYLDAACTQPAARGGWGPPLTAGQWVSGIVPGTEPSCQGQPLAQRVGYRVGEQLFVGGLDALAKPLPSVFVATASQCQPSTVQTGLLPADLFRLERRDEHDFVAATPAVRPATGAFTVERLIADDGAELTVGVRGQDAVRCQVQADGRCVPGPVSVSSFLGPGEYLDGDCTKPAFSLAAANLCGDPKFGVKPVAGQVHVYELQKTDVVFAKLAERDPDTGIAIVDADGQPRYSCLSETSAVAYAAGKDVTSAFALAGATEAAVGAFRLVQHGSPTTGSAGTASPRIAFEGGGVFVDEQGQGCRTRATSDHKLECDPTGPEILESGFWKDAACQHRLYDFFGPHDASAPDVSLLRDVGRFGEMSRAWLSFRAYSGPVYRPNGDACEPTGFTNLLLDVDRALALPDLPLVER